MVIKCDGQMWKGEGKGEGKGEVKGEVKGDVKGEVKGGVKGDVKCEVKGEGMRGRKCSNGEYRETFRGRRGIGKVWSLARGRKVKEQDEMQDRRLEHSGQRTSS